MAVEFRQFTDDLNVDVFINPLLVRSIEAWGSYEDDVHNTTRIVFDNEHAIVVKGSPEQVAERLTILNYD